MNLIQFVSCGALAGNFLGPSCGDSRCGPIGFRVQCVVLCRAQTKHPREIASQSTHDGIAWIVHAKNGESTRCTRMPATIWPCVLRHAHPNHVKHVLHAQKLLCATCTLRNVVAFLAFPRVTNQFRQCLSGAVSLPESRQSATQRVRLGLMVERQRMVEVSRAEARAGLRSRSHQPGSERRFTTGGGSYSGGGPLPT